jgi:hypothetical protein
MDTDSIAAKEHTERKGFLPLRPGRGGSKDSVEMHPSQLAENKKAPANRGWKLVWN